MTVNVNSLHPTKKIIMIMERIYGYGMTTTSGGNLSIKDADGSIWITPGSLDKGNLKPEQIVRIKPEGTWEGPHPPSLEAPFHASIYEVRPDICAIIHAHPPALMSFSLAGRPPDTAIMPQTKMVCGEVGFASYAIPGSRELADNIAREFAKGRDAVIMENHSVVVGGADILDAFRRFETLDFCARIHIHARSLGEVNLLTEEDFRLEGTAVKEGALPDLPAASCVETESGPASGRVPASRTMSVRDTMCTLIRRAYDQMLFTSTQGTFSARLDDGSFLITPYGMDRKYLEPEDLVHISGGCKEAGKSPSRSVLLHDAIYRRNTAINAVMIAHPPHAMAFSVTGTDFTTRVMPESYVFLRDVPILPFGVQRRDYESTAAVFDNHPAAIVANDCVIVTGKDLIGCFDKLEITEYIAHSLIWAKSLGGVRELPEKDLKDLRAFWK